MNDIWKQIEDLSGSIDDLLWQMNKLSKALNEIIEIITKTELQDYAGGPYYSVKEFGFVQDILEIIENTKEVVKENCPKRQKSSTEE